jgi:hypothetical protein
MQPTMPIMPDMDVVETAVEKPAEGVAEVVSEEAQVSE